LFGTLFWPKRFIQPFRGIHTLPIFFSGAALIKYSGLVGAETKFASVPLFLSVQFRSLVAELNLFQSVYRGGNLVLFVLVEWCLHAELGLLP